MSPRPNDRPIPIYRMTTRRDPEIARLRRLSQRILGRIDELAIRLELERKRSEELRELSEWVRSPRLSATTTGEASS